MALKADKDSPEGVLLSYEIDDFVRGDSFYLKNALRVQACSGLGLPRRFVVAPWSPPL